MPWLTDFLTANLGFISFLHGLALFSVGLSLAVDITRSQAGSELHSSLPFFVCSTFLLAAGAWLEMVVPAGSTPPALGMMLGLGLLARVAGAVCLSAFGASLISAARNKSAWLRWSPIALLAFWCLLVAVVPSRIAEPMTGELWLLRADAWARCVLFLPGGVAAGLGLMYCGRLFDARGLIGVGRDCQGAAVTIAVGGLLGGLSAVAPSPLPVSIVNGDRLPGAVGVSAGLLLAVLTVVTGVLVMRALRGIDSERLAEERSSAEEQWRSERAALEAASKRCQELEAVNAELARANEAKSRFLAIAAHDLKSPLAATQSYLHVLLGGFTGDLQPKQREMLERCSNRIQDLLALIGDLMDTTKIETGQLVVEREPVDLAAVAVASIENVRLPIAYKGIKLDLVLPDGECRVLGSKHRLQQLLTNLLSNAAKYTPEMGSITLVVREEDDWAHIELADTGPGIPPDALPHIFEEFYKVDGADGRRNLGLGLFIARKIVEAHGGEIQAESPCCGTGEGTRFLIKLPRHVPS